MSKKKIAAWSIPEQTVTIVLGQGATDLEMYASSELVKYLSRLFDISISKEHRGDLAEVSIQRVAILMALEKSIIESRSFGVRLLCGFWHGFGSCR